jgi:hypothetical protein
MRVSRPGFPRDPGVSWVFRRPMPCPGSRGGKELDSAAIIVQGDDMVRRGYPPEFRRRVVELVEDPSPLIQTQVMNSWNVQVSQLSDTRLLSLSTLARLQAFL